MFVSEIIDQVAEVLGRCDREKALQRISDAVIALQDEGDWNANIGAMDITTFSDGNILTLPRDVETPLAVAVNNNPTFMRDEFYRYHLNGEGLSDDNVVSWAWDDEGAVPNFMDIGTPGPLVVYCDLLNDVGRIVRVLGFDASGREIRTQLEDGEWVAGVRYAAAKVAGIPMSQPTAFQFRRYATTTSAFKFLSAVDHKLVTGAEMQILIQTGTFPEPLINGGFYFIRVESPTEVSVFRTRLDAQTGQNRLYFSEFAPASTVNLIEKRPVTARTQFQTVGASQLAQNSRVMFSATTIPTGISNSKIYRTVPTGSTNFIIYENEEDANLGTNVINVSDAGSVVKLRTLQQAYPVTKMVFGVPHNMLTGDQVTMENSGGTLPEPLLSGVAYFVNVIDANQLTVHESLIDATSGTNPITLTTFGTGTNSILKTIPASVAGGGSSVVTTTVPHNLTAPSGSGATAEVVTNNGSVTGINITNGGSGYFTPPVVQITGGGTGALAEAVVSGGIITAVRIVSGGTGYAALGPGKFCTAAAATDLITAPGHSFIANQKIRFQSLDGGAPLNNTTDYYVRDLAGDTFKVSLTPGGAVIDITSNMNSGSVSAAPIAPAVAFIPQGGSLVRFTTNGTLPQPITANTVYVGETTGVPNQFTLKTTFPENVKITSTGAGQLYAIISRSFSVGFLPQWKIDATNLSTGLGVQFYATGRLPTTVPSQVNPTTFYFVRKINNQVIELYDTQANALLPPPSTTGQISAIIAGDQETFLFTERDVQVIPRDSYLDISFTSFLANQVEVKFSTTGTLPSPLVPGSPYLVTVVDDKISLTTVGNVPVVLGTVGSGTHSMEIQRTMSVLSSTSMTVHDHDFETGSAVTFSNEGGTLPGPLSPTTTYYARAIDADTLELYSTSAQALAIPSTTGRIVFTSSGDGTTYIRQDRTPISFSKITAVEKEETDGYLRVYAWDTSRANNVALIGDYAPTEKVPSYRRIKIMKNAKSVRIKYRRRPIEIFSERDFINLDSRMAILMMVQSQELLFKKFVDEAERYRIIAVEYLNKRNRALDGARAPTVQINADVMNVPHDWMD